MRNVGAGADLERDLPLGQFSLYQISRVMDRPNPVARAARPSAGRPSVSRMESGPSHSPVCAVQRRPASAAMS